MHERLLKIASVVVTRADRNMAADRVLRTELRSQRGLMPQESRAISRVVFAYYRWVGWLNAADALPKRLEEAAELQQAFREHPQSTPDAELSRAVPPWIFEHLTVTFDWLRSLQSEPRLWLRARRGTGKGVELGTGLVDGDDQGVGCEIDLEAARAFHLRHEVGVGQRGAVAEAERAALAVCCQQRFQRLEPGNDPGGAPGQYVDLTALQRVAQIFQHAPVVQGVDVAADDGRERAHPGALLRVGGQQCRRGIPLFQPLDDGGRLDQDQVALDQRRHQPLRIERLERGSQMLFAAQVHRHVVVIQLFQVERDAQAV